MMYFSRSSKLLSSRGPSYPTLPLDLSEDLANENHFRRRAHTAVLERNSSCFRRKRNDESPSSLALQQHQLRDLLGTMHPTKDYEDIDLKGRGYTFSRLSTKLQQDQHNLEEYHFRTMTPLEDFVRPEEYTQSRNTGYEHGHIRSLMKLDVYGPTASKKSAARRSRQKLPKANPDRYERLSPEHKLNLSASPANSLSGRRTRESERNGSYRDRDGFDSFNDTGDNSSRASSTSRQSFHSRESSNQPSITSSEQQHIDQRRRKLELDASHHRLDLTIPSSLRDVKENFGLTRITYEDRLSFDPFVRRKQYDKVNKNKTKVISFYFIFLFL
jgi:hypothetical protein